MPWLELVLKSDPAHAKALAEILENSGAAAVTFRDGADQPIFEPGPDASDLWDYTEVVGLFDDQSGVDLALTTLRNNETPTPDYRLEPLEDRDWVRAWMDDYEPMRFGDRLYVVPLEMPVPDPDAVNLRLDPGLAFGTGTHPTTALCLRWLEQQDLCGKTIIDYGCGSGILAIAALLLGADKAIGVDNDPQALIASRDNARVNGVEDRLDVYLPEDTPNCQAPILIANILAGPLMELAPVLATHMQAHTRFALSGVLAEQADIIAERYRAFSDMAEPEFDQGWTLLTGKHH